MNKKQSIGLAVLIIAVFALVGAHTDSFDKIFLDSATNAVNTVDYSHHEIHEGDHFFYKSYADLANGASVVLLFKTPDTDRWAHASWILDSEAEYTFTLHEASTTTANGTTVVTFNNNRNSLTTPTVAAYSAPTVTVPGTLIWSSKVGAGKKSGGSGSVDLEIIGKRNTKYVFKLKNDSGGQAWVNYNFLWYEHTNI